MNVDLFRVSVLDRTREEVERKYRLPTRTREDPIGTWAGPIHVYEGTFTDAMGQVYPVMELYFREGRVGLAAASGK